MTFLVIHERGNWSAISLAKTIEEAENKAPPCCSHTLPESFYSRHKARRAIGGGNGELQIEVARCSEDTRQDA